MAGIYFLVRGKQNPSPIYLRFFNGRKINAIVKTALLVNPKHWDVKKQRVRNIVGATQKDLINATLEKLSAYVFERMNEDSIAGRLVDRAWVKKTVPEFFGQRDDKKKGTSVTEWIEEYIEKAPTLIKKNKENPLSQNTIKTYKTTLIKLKAFQEHKNTQLKFGDVNLAFHKEFIEYLSKTERLGSSQVRE